MTNICIGNADVSCVLGVCACVLSIFGPLTQEKILRVKRLYVLLFYYTGLPSSELLASLLACSGKLKGT